MNYWQVGCGADERDYSQVFFDFGVALVGPGDKGPYQENKDNYREEDKKKIEPLLMMNPGDRIVLRSGRQYMVAVGEVVPNGKYGHSMLFSDIDGWDLQHCIEIEWRRLEKDFGKSILSMSTLKGLGVKEVIDFIENHWSDAEVIPKKYSIDAIPIEDTDTKRVTDDELEEFLIRKGLRIGYAENMTQTIRRVRKLSMWYLNEGKDSSSEYEVRSFLVVPFLLALGWSEQRIGIEVPIGRKKIDMVLYESPERNVPLALIETKKIWTGLNWASQQLVNYASFFPSTKYLIATDGLRYSLYENESGAWNNTAYMNFRKMLDRHTCYKDINGIKHLVTALLPI